MFIRFIYQKLLSNDPVERNFAYLISLLCFNTLLYIYLYPPYGSIGCTIWSVLIVSLIYLIFYVQNTIVPMIGEAECRYFYESLKFIIYIMLLFVCLVFFNGVNEVQRHRYFQNELIYDEMLIKIDQYLLGNWFPKGQVSLYLDTNTKIGVKTLIGRIYAEVFQIFYFSYYFFGNCFAGYMLLLYFQNSNNNLYAKLQNRLVYRMILMFLTSWVSGFLFAFMINLLFPAVSPRIYLKYENEIEGFFFCEKFRNLLTSVAANTFGAFPSAHCGISWLVPIYAHRIEQLHIFHNRQIKWFKWVSIIGAVMINISTVVMRYHYFVDFVAGFILTALSAVFGGFHTKKHFEKCVEIENLNNLELSKIPV